MFLSLVPKRTSHKGALGPFSSRSLEKEPNPKGWYRGSQKGGTPTIVMAGHSFPFCLLSVPAPSAPVAFSTLLRCRQSLPVG